MFATISRSHAVLDSIRPVLFDAESDEVAAFHEAFADISAILSTLQLERFRISVLEETEGKLQNTSRLSRFGEQVGAAIRRQRPDTVEQDCLRHAANSFFYTDPKGLAPSGPVINLSSTPHSFCRVFTGAFLVNVKLKLDELKMAKKAIRSKTAKTSKQAPSSEAFRKGLAARGEAAEVRQNGTLPEGATHEIVGYDSNGLPIVKRLRFSLHG